jgi:uncharacterized protein YdeI (YjbR/CyaY-like superfamily)
VSPVYFTSAAAFRKWLEKNHTKASEVFVGFYKKDAGKTGITYKEALEEALCFGWIDGVRKRVDGESYMNRFTPRKAKSYWSAVNIAHAKRLIAAVRMCPSGLAAFERRDRTADAKYSFEREAAAFSPAQLKTFKADAKAWAFFSAQPPGYRRLATFWVVDAKKEETQSRRLTKLIADSRAGRRLDFMPSAKTS